MAKNQFTPRARFVRYLKQMLHWQSLPRGATQHKAMRKWLGRGEGAEFRTWGEHPGGKPPVEESGTGEGQHSKQQRDAWKHGWRERINDDPELTKLAEEAGVLDKPRPDAMPGDFANPDPRVYKQILPPPPAPQGTEELPPSIDKPAWDFFNKRS